MSNPARFETHEVFNQPPPYGDVDLYGQDRALQEAVAANGGGGGSAFSVFGRHWGSAEMAEAARLAEVHPPE
jgi:putative acyl-CoA dehydrogenase